jgi:beta-1,4-mannosyltransferase
MRIHNDPNIIFQITTRSATKTDVVKRGIRSIINSSLEISYYKFDDTSIIEHNIKNKIDMVRGRVGRNYDFYVINK